MTETSIPSAHRLGLGAILVTIAGLVWSCAAKPTAKPAELKAAAASCTATRDLACAEQNWKAYVQARPNDSNAGERIGSGK